MATEVAQAAVQWDSRCPQSLRGALSVGLVASVIATLRWTATHFAAGGVPDTRRLDPARGRRIAAAFEGALAGLAGPRLAKRVEISSIQGAPVAMTRIVPRRGVRNSPRLFYVHGGSFVLERGPLHDVLAAQLAERTGCEVVAVDYRLAPEHPFPAALDDVLAAYRWLLRSDDAGDIAMFGDSAGAGLALAALQRVRSQRLPMPFCLCLLCPWADLTFSGASIISNAGDDPMLSDLDAITAFAEMYRGAADPGDPLLSPVFADFSGFPPTLIHAGSSDVLRSDAERLAAGLRQAGAITRLEVWEHMPHVWQRLGAMVPEAADSVQRMAAFIERTHQRDRAA